MQDLLSKTFKAVSDPHRLLILGILKHRPMFVCQLAKSINLAYSTTSQHLRILTEAGLIISQNNGKWVKYCIARQSVNPYSEKIFSLVDDCLNSDAEFKKQIEDIVQKQIDPTCR